LIIKTQKENKDSNFLIICDHASNNIPSNFANLGLDKEILDTHIAYDIGAKEVSVHLSNILDCPLVMSDFSRLLIDPNRGIDDPTLIMRISDDKIIEGNKKIHNFKEDEFRNNRIKKYYNAYHNKILELINFKIKNKKYPAIISIHSFTPFWKNKKRDIDIGILWDNDDRLPKIFFNYFQKNNRNLIIGNNKPYSGRLKNDTIYKHATMNGLSNILIELRQDLIKEKKGQEFFANLIAKPLLLNKDNPVLFEKSFHTSLAK
tara:strand:- start:878 stop:1660 length:783 start_codon:yes stop_codon:yes gene_type:complete